MDKYKIKERLLFCTLKRKWDCSKLNLRFYSKRNDRRTYIEGGLVKEMF
jgi:hypothetical protein